MVYTLHQSTHKRPTVAFLNFLCSQISRDNRIGPFVENVVKDTEGPLTVLLHPKIIQNQKFCTSNFIDQKLFLAHAAIEATKKLGVAGIITDGETGQTARDLAAFRGPNPV